MFATCCIEVAVVDIWDASICYLSWVIINDILIASDSNTSCHSSIHVVRNEVWKYWNLYWKLGKYNFLGAVPTSNFVKYCYKRDIYVDYSRMICCDQYLHQLQNRGSLSTPRPFQNKIPEQATLFPHTALPAIWRPQWQNIAQIICRESDIRVTSGK